MHTRTCTQQDYSSTRTHPVAGIKSPMTQNRRDSKPKATSTNGSRMMSMMRLTVRLRADSGQALAMVLRYTGQM